MKNPFVIKSWDSKMFYKAQRFDIEFWIRYPVMLINKGKSYNFTPQDILDFGTKEEATKQMFKMLGQEARNMEHQGTKGKVIKKTPFAYIPHLIDVPPQYQKVFRGEE